MFCDRRGESGAQKRALVMGSFRSAVYDAWYLWLSRRTLHFFLSVEVCSRGVQIYRNLCQDNLLPMHAVPNKRGSDPFLLLRFGWTILDIPWNWPASDCSGSRPGDRHKVARKACPIAVTPSAATPSRPPFTGLGLRECV